jgi:hypothetical protein
LIVSTTPRRLRAPLSGGRRASVIQEYQPQRRVGSATLDLELQACEPDSLSVNSMRLGATRPTEARMSGVNYFFGSR